MNDGSQSVFQTVVQVVCLGARQHGLPLDYIEKLEAVQTNDYKGPSILDTLEGIEAASSS